jgi:nicotinamidase/pyrazinamidase
MWDVDTQVDFMFPGRPLHVPGAEAILPNLAALTHHAREAGLRILGSEDWHSLADPEISERPDWVTTWPPHCLAGTEGQLRVPETRPLDPLYVDSAPLPSERLERLVRAHRGEILFRKQTVDAFEQPNVEPVLALVRPSAVVIYGVALDVCVSRAIEGFLRSGRAELFLVTDATRAIDSERGQALIGGWRERGVRMLTTPDVLAGALADVRAGAASGSAG